MEILVVAAFAWLFGGWLINKSPTIGFLVFSILVVVVGSLLVGFVLAGLLAASAGVSNSFGAAVEGALRGTFLGLLFGGWSTIKGYRSTRTNPSVSVQREPE